jgi:hypothetical protein
MGIIRQGILGGFSGKVANVVGSSWKGIAIVKSLPLSVANPRTAAQVGQREKMASCVEALKPILSEVIKPLNDRFAGQMSGYNYSLQESIKAFNASGTFVNPANFRISRASNKGTLIDATAAEAKINKLRCSYANEAGQGFALATDKAYLAARNRENGDWAISTSTIRSSGSAVVEFADGSVETGDTIDLYLAFLRADGTVGFAQSYSQYIAVAP